MVQKIRGSLGNSFIKADPYVVVKIFKFFNLSEIMLFRGLCRQVMKIIELNSNEFTVVETAPHWNHIDVSKLLVSFPKLNQIHFRHYLTNLDVINVFQSYEQTLV